MESSSACSSSHTQVAVRCPSHADSVECFEKHVCLALATQQHTAQQQRRPNDLLLLLPPTFILCRQAECGLLFTDRSGAFVIYERGGCISTNGTLEGTRRMNLCSYPVVWLRQHTKTKQGPGKAISARLSARIEWGETPGSGVKSNLVGDRQPQQQAANKQEVISSCRSQNIGIPACSTSRGSCTTCVASILRPPAPPPTHACLEEGKGRQKKHTACSSSHTTLRAT